VYYWTENGQSKFDHDYLYSSRFFVVEIVEISVNFDHLTMTTWWQKLYYSHGQNDTFDHDHLENLRVLWSWSPLIPPPSIVRGSESARTLLALLNFTMKGCLVMLFRISRYEFVDMRRGILLFSVNDLGSLKTSASYKKEWRTLQLQQISVWTILIRNKVWSFSLPIEKL
jgi:hypothetical protein